MDSKCYSRLEHYVLTLTDRSPANDVVFDYIAEAVSVSGTVYETDLGKELRIAADSIVRR